jgi:molybdopterin synthase catalytic subunit
MKVMSHREFSADNDVWLEITADVLDVGAVYNWSVTESCGAVVLFSGTVRNHSEGRTDVHTLSYEAFEEEVIPKCREIVLEMKNQWSDLGRIALIHRVGDLTVGESSVLVVVSGAHRPEAFEAARFGIDALKATVPIWKRETWATGSDWALGAQHVTTVDQVAHAQQREASAR